MTSGYSEQFATKLDQHVKEHLRANQQQKSVGELDAMIGLLLLNKPDVVESPVTTEVTETVQAPMTSVATTSRETLATTEIAETICTSTSTRTVEPTTLQATPTKGAVTPIRILMEALVVTDSLETTNAQTTVVAPATIDGPAPETTQSPTIAHLPTATVAATGIQSPIGENIEAPTISGASTSMQTPTTFVPISRSTPTTVQPPKRTHAALNTSRIHYTVAARGTTKQAPTPKRYAVAAQAATTQQQQIVKHYPTTILYAGAAAPLITMQQPPTTTNYPITVRRYAGADSRPPTAQQAPAAAAAVAPAASPQKRPLPHCVGGAISRLQQRPREVPADRTIQPTRATLESLRFHRLDAESMYHQARVLFKRFIPKWWLRRLETTNAQTTVVAPATIDGPAPETTQSPTIAHLPTATAAATGIQSPIGENTEAPTTSGASMSMQTPTTFVPTARSTPTTVQPPAVAPPASPQRRYLPHLLEAVINRLQQRRIEVPADQTIQSSWAELAELQESLGFQRLDAEPMDYRAVLRNKLCAEYLLIMTLLDDFVYSVLEE